MNRIDVERIFCPRCGQCINRNEKAVGVHARAHDTILGKGYILETIEKACVRNGESKECRRLYPDGHPNPCATFYENNREVRRALDYVRDLRGEVLEATKAMKLVTELNFPFTFRNWVSDCQFVPDNICAPCSQSALNALKRLLI
jgi:hypothetical protein